MAEAVANPGGVMLDASGVPLKVALARAERSKKVRAFLLVLPLLAFILVSFVFPIIQMLYRSVDNSVISENMPNFSRSILKWDGKDLPGEDIFTLLADDLRQAFKDKNHGKVASRLNYDIAGARSMITDTAKGLKKKTEGPYRDWLIELNPLWGDHSTWIILQKASDPISIGFYLNSLDLRFDEQTGDIVAQPEDRQIYVTLFLRTLWVSLGITAICILLAYPISFLMATLRLRTSNLLMILVLLPFWTSLLVRTTSWIALLQSKGVLNDIMVALGIISDEGRLEMIYNMTGTFVAMTHILLPFMVLPLFSVMKTIPPSYMRAARSLGANPVYAFWKIYVPLTIPGVGAGSILVFILAVGYYITPALVGGRTGQLISNFIAFHMQKSLNWGLAAALAGVLLLCVLVLYTVYNRVIGIDKMKMG